MTALSYRRTRRDREKEGISFEQLQWFQTSKQIHCSFKFWFSLLILKFCLARCASRDTNLQASSVFSVFNWHLTQFINHINSLSYYLSSILTYYITQFKCNFTVARTVCSLLIRLRRLKATATMNHGIVSSANASVSCYARPQRRNIFLSMFITARRMCLIFQQ